MRATAVSAMFMAIIMVVLLGSPLIATAQTPGQDTLIVGVQNDTPNLVPWDIATNSIWKAFLWENWVYENLYSLTPDGSNIYAVLADGNPSADLSGLNVTVKIRTGVTFTDGQPMNMTDVLFSYQVMAFNSQLSDPVLKSIVYPDATWPRWNATLTPWGAAHPSHVGITATDATTLVFHLRQPYSMFYFGTLPTPIMPAHIWKDHLVQVNLNNFAIPGGATIDPSQPEFDFDTSFGSSPSQVQATIGTGPWYLVQWTPLVSAEIRIYDGYWGKAQTITFQGTTYPFFPNNLRTIQFRIYGTLDVAVLALKSGEVHIVPWNLPIGFYNDLRQDPRMGFKISASDGFYYLSFNMRKAPMNDLNFRRAVGFAIDKDFIVDRLLAGFGIKGQVPISPVNPGYINSSALAPPFNLDQANAILDAAGYTYSGQYRTMPGGAPLKLSILTPAKDYDPVRADTGIMVANNLKAIGLNIDSSPTAFDAIVSAVFTAVQFDMYILGWVNLGPFPELYLSDFFGCNALVELGTGDNTPGFCNPQMEGYLNTLDSSMNNAQRIQAAKDAEGLLTQLLPYNTLYNTRQIEGYRADVWSGWVPIRGEIFNAFSFGILGASGVVVPSGPLTISLDGPGVAVAGSSPAFQVYAVQAGRPASGVSIELIADTGQTATGTTDARGYVQISLAMPSPDLAQSVNIIASATKGTFGGGDYITVNAVPATDVAQLLLSVDRAVVAPSGTATVTAKVTNKIGTPIAGVPIEVIPQLVLGNVTPSNATTGPDGTATYTYTAPILGLIPNRNVYDYIKASAFVPNKPNVISTQSQTLAVGVENSVYDWYILNITSVSSYVVDTLPGPIPGATTVQVSVTKQDLSPVANEPVTISLSNATALTPDATTKNTNGAGVVSFTLTANTPISTPVAVSFSVERAFASQSGLSILVTDGSTPDTATSMLIGSRFINPNGPAGVTITVYDRTGTPLSGANVKIWVPYTSVGNPITASGTGWTFTANVGTDFNGTTDATGKVQTTFSARSFTSDNVIVMETGIGGFGPIGTFAMEGVAGVPVKTYFNENIIQKRNKVAAIQSYVMTPNELSNTQATADITVKLMDANGPAANTNISIYRGTGDLRPGKGATKIGYYLTDASGQATAHWTEPVHTLSLPAGFTTVITSTNYALGGQVGSVPFEQIYAYIVPPDLLVPTGAPQSTIVSLGNAQVYNVTLKDFSGKQVQGATVKAMVAGNVSAQTDGTGFASLAVMPATSGLTPSNPTDVSEIVFQITKGSNVSSVQMGTMVGMGVYSYTNLSVPGSATVGEVATITVDVKNTGAVLDTAVVVLMMDGKPYSAQTVQIGPDSSVTVSFAYVPSDTNSHAFSVGGLPEASLTAGGAGTSMLVVAGVGIVLLIVGILIGFFIGKMGKKPEREETVPQEINQEQTPPTPPPQ